MAGPEKLFEEKVKKYLTSKGCWWVKYWGGAQFTKAGVPDLLCCIGGRFVAIELKAPNGRPSKLQLHVIGQIKQAGGVAMVLYPDGFEDFKEMVEVMMINA